MKKKIVLHNKRPRRKGCVLPFETRAKNDMFVAQALKLKSHATEGAPRTKERTVDIYNDAKHVWSD